jgi:penicillin-binding protein-related factor A (putative recombinase)
VEELPPLPKQNEKKEADFGLVFRHWIEENKMDTCAFELKHTRGEDSLPFREVKAEQIAYATEIESDEGCLIRVIGHNGEPDYIYMRKEPAYFLIRYQEFYCIVRRSSFLEERNTSTRKSLTSDRAREIAIKVIYA